MIFRNKASQVSLLKGGRSLFLLILLLWQSQALPAEASCVSFSGGSFPDTTATCVLWTAGDLNIASGNRTGSLEITTEAGATLGGLQDWASYADGITTITNLSNITGTDYNVYSFSGMSHEYVGLFVSSNNVGSILNEGSILLNREADSAFLSSYTSVSQYGIQGQNHIDLIRNTGTIYVSTTYVGAGLGIDYSNNVFDVALSVSGFGSLDRLENTGLIEAKSSNVFSSGESYSGSYAIYTFYGSIGTIENTGTIAGNIFAYNDEMPTQFLFTGGTASDYGVLKNGTITADSVIFDNAAYQLLEDDIRSTQVTNEGTLLLKSQQTITGNYTQSASGSLAIGITNETTYGSLIVSGTATMTGSTVQLLPDQTTSLSVGQSYIVVQASSADYSDMTSSARGYLTSLSSTYDGTYEDLIVTITGVDAPYTATTSTTGSRNLQNLGSALDRLLTSGATGYTTLFNALDATSGSSQTEAIGELLPSEVAPQMISSSSIASQIGKTISQHQEAFLPGGEGREGKAAGDAYQNGVFWGQVMGGYAKKTPTSASSGYDQNYYGLTVGVDSYLEKNTTLGGALSWVRNRAEGTGQASGENMTVQSVQLSLYGTQRFGATYLEGLLGAGINMFEQSRPIEILGKTAKAHYDGYQLMGRLEGGHVFDVSRYKITPYAGIQAVRASNEGYTETGADGANVSVNSKTVDTYTTTLGTKLSTTLPTSFGQITPEAKIAWTHDLTHGPIVTQAMIGGESFTMQTPRVAEDGLQLGLSVGLKQSDDFEIKAAYQAELRRSYTSHTGLVKLMWNY